MVLPTRWQNELSLSLFLLPFANCACGCPFEAREELRSCYHEPALQRTDVVIHDARGNLIPAESLVVDESGEGSSCRLSQGLVSCLTVVDQPTVLHVNARGESFEVTLQWSAAEHAVKECSEWRGETVQLTLAGTGCPASDEDAVTGRLLDKAGQPADGQVRIDVLGEVRPCVVEQGFYRCPSVTSFDAQYTLYAQLGTSDIGRLVTVHAVDCHITPEVRDIDLRALACSDDRTALEGYVVTSANGDVPSSARVSFSSGESADCTTTPLALNRGRGIEFKCDRLSATGGGAYLLELSDGKRTRTLLQELKDDGCHALSSYLMLDFEQL